MSKLEKELERKVVKWCKDHGVLCIKFTPMGDRGWPDRILVFPGGKHVWLELKAPGKVPRPLQFHRMEQLSNAGAETVWADDFDICMAVLEEYL